MPTDTSTPEAPAYELVRTNAEAIQKVEASPELVQQTGSLAGRMRSIVEVLNDDQCNVASQLVADAKGICARADDWFKPMKEAAHAAHKALCTRNSEVKAELESEAGRLQKSINAFATRKRQEEEEKRRAEEAERERQRQEAERLERERLEAARLAEAQRLEDEAQAKELAAAQLAEQAQDADAERNEEAERLASLAEAKHVEAQGLMDAGDVEGGNLLLQEATTLATKAMELVDTPSAHAQVERLQREAAEAARRADEMLTRPIEVAPAAKAYSAPVTVSASSVTKGLGLKGREVWKFEITDENAIPREWLMVNDKAIAAYVKAQKGGAKIAGVRVYSEVETSIGASKG